MFSIHTFKAGWSGLLHIDIVVNSDKSQTDASLSEASTILENELTDSIKEAISDVFDGFSDGGGLMISDVTTTPFTEEETDEQDEVPEE